MKTENTGQRLNIEWGINAEHALFSRTGETYDRLKRFPGALFDKDGFVLFSRKQDYEQSPYLHIKKKVTVPGGIKQIPIYKKRPQGKSNLRSELEDSAEPLPDLDVRTTGAKIRERKLRAHLRKERSTSLRTARLEIARQQGELHCEVCGLCFGNLPREVGEACCEVHHKIPVASLLPGTMVRLKDLAVVCSNCHRMIHAKNPPHTPTQLKRKLASARS